MNVTHTLLAAAVGLALPGSAQAVHLDAGGRGQVLIYPYYTVNNHQQTLLSVTNSTGAGQAVRVRFNEVYNGRSVMEFNLWLSPYDVWTGTVFALEDAGRPGQGAAIITRDRSCTSPRFTESNTTLVDGTPYVAFANYAFVGINADGGPTATSRTREGFIEIIAMADVTAPLLAAITHTGANQSPPNCAAVRPNSIVGTAAVSTKPSGGLSGTASIVNVGQGTLLAARAEALAGFTGVSLFTSSEVLFRPYYLPNLASVNDGVPGGPATALRFDNNGRPLSLSYGGPGVTTSRPIDAVSAVLMADQVYNEYVISPTLNAGSDWLVTFPTKPFYVDPIFAGAVALRPFEKLFSEDAAGRSTIRFVYAVYDRETRKSPIEWAGTPPPFEESMMHYATNVLPFFNPGSGPALMQSQVVGSRLLGTFGGYLPNTHIPYDAGWARLITDYGDEHRLAASNEGKVLRGLPLVGFWATNLVNNAVSDGVLSNYAAAVRHATSVTCVKASDGTACE